MIKRQSPSNLSAVQGQQFVEHLRRRFALPCGVGAGPVWSGFGRLVRGLFAIHHSGLSVRILAAVLVATLLAANCCELRGSQPVAEEVSSLLLLTQLDGEGAEAEADDGSETGFTASLVATLEFHPQAADRTRFGLGHPLIWRLSRLGSRGPPELVVPACCRGHR